MLTSPAVGRTAPVCACVCVRACVKPDLCYNKTVLQCSVIQVHPASLIHSVDPVWVQLPSSLPPVPPLALTVEFGLEVSMG